MTDTDCAQSMNLNNFDDLLTFPLVPPSGQKNYLSSILVTCKTPISHNCSLYCVLIKCYHANTLDEDVEHGKCWTCYILVCRHTKT